MRCGNCIAWRCCATSRQPSSVANEGTWLSRLAACYAPRDDGDSNDSLACLVLILPTAPVGGVTIMAFNNPHTDWSRYAPLVIGYGCVAAAAWVFAAIRWRRKMRAGTLGKGVWPTLGVGWAVVAIALASLAWFT